MCSSDLIRVGAGLIQFVYGSHSRLSADLTLDKNLFFLPFSRASIYIGEHCWQDGVSLRVSNTDGNPFVWVCRMETPQMGLSRVILLPN